MNKYDERVAKILEKKKEYDAEKKQKRKTVFQSVSIILTFVILISVLIIVPRRTGINVKPENSTSLTESQTKLFSSTTEAVTEKNETASATVPSTIKPFYPLVNEGVGGGGDDFINTYEPKYRELFYNIGLCFAQLVSDEEYYEWRKQYQDKYYTEDEGEEIKEPKRMRIVDFVMYFDIPREVFEEANNTRCHEMIKWGDVPVMNPKDYMEQEEFEVYNVDIIYTFDDEIINAYYERGEYPFETKEEYLEAIKYHGYITQTEEFIMLEGFEKVTLPGLPPDAEPIWIDFDWRSKRCK